jgi:hypothetical protein
MLVAPRSPAGRDLLFEAWLLSQLRTETEMTAEEYGRALEELAPTQPTARALDRLLPLPAVSA